MIKIPTESGSSRLQEYDVAIVGSGTSGATLARELSSAGKKVVVLERGRYAPLNEKVATLFANADEVKLGPEGLSSISVSSAGGASSMYFAIAENPPLDAFAAYGIDLTSELAAVNGLLKPAPAPDTHFGVKPAALQRAAEALGYDWRRRDMLIDFSKAVGGYAYDAKWKARDFLDEAVRNGATLIDRATVDRVLIESGRAVGVEYRVKRGFGTDTHHVRARKVVIAAGEMATPQILRANGVGGIGARGFYCNPGYALYGIVPGLRGEEGFVGCSSAAIEPDIELGDANVHRIMHRLMMLGRMKWRHLLSFPETLGIGVKVKDTLGGELRPDGRFHKVMDTDDQKKLDRGRREAIRVLEKSGAKRIVDFGLTAAGRVGGLVRIGEHIDTRFETEVGDLHVCDGSMIPDEMRGPPAVTIVCMARYLSKSLLTALSPETRQAQPAGAIADACHVSTQARQTRG